MDKDKFRKWFKEIKGFEPYDFQVRFATESQLPSLVSVPTGCGKTAMALMGWLWRRVACNDDIIRSQTPRRLVFCLPMRVLVEQTFNQAKEICHSRYNQVQVFKIMGGEQDDDYMFDPDQDSIIIGTQDLLISRALNRGYAASRYRWPIDFGLFNNDCLWVLDEIQLMGAGLATTTQMEAFRNKFKTFGNTQTVWMSATLDKNWLKTVDFKESLETLQPLTLSDQDKNQIQARLTAPKFLEKYHDTCPSKQEEQTEFYGELADKIHTIHQQGTRTLVIVNTVKRAQDVYEKLKVQLGIKRNETNESLMLIHSRFRPEERIALNKKLTKIPTSGRIIVATQVVEAGVDISSKTMITEVAPWSSMVQRFGRCNREGEYQDKDNEAKIYWIDLDDDTAKPYDEEELKKARENLAKFEGQSVSPQAIEDARLSVGEYQPKHVIRRKDILELFDTTPDLTGADLDISRFVRDEEDNRDVHVFWREWDEKQKPKDIKPRREELCQVPVYQLAKLRDILAYKWDYLDKSWKRIYSNELYPGLIVLLHSSVGGYHMELGWTGEKKDKLTAENLFENKGTLESYDGDPHSISIWQSIAQHTDDVVRELDLILERLSLQMEHNIDLHKVLSTTARWHDWGKAHTAFQAKFGPEQLTKAPIQGFAAKAPDQAWVKGKNSHEHYRKYFRHELATALGMLQQGFKDLEVYLAASHHGKVRLSIRSMPDEKLPSNPETLNARGVWDGDTLPETELGGGVIAPQTTLSLACMQLGRSEDGKPSWMERMLKLRDQWGIFRLACLEALLRAADQRASKEKKNDV